MALAGDERFHEYDPDRDQVDDWSRAIYARVRGWAVAEHGTWRWWKTGELELISTSDGSQIFDPVYLSTTGDELTLYLDQWHVHLPRDMGAADAVDTAITYVADWFAGRLLVVTALDLKGRLVAVSHATAEDLIERLESCARMRRSCRVEVRRSSGHNDLYAVQRSFIRTRPRLAQLRNVR